MSKLNSATDVSDEIGIQGSNTLDNDSFAYSVNPAVINYYRQAAIEGNVRARAIYNIACRTELENRLYEKIAGNKNINGNSKTILKAELAKMEEFGYVITASEGLFILRGVLNKRLKEIEAEKRYQL